MAFLAALVLAALSSAAMAKADGAEAYKRCAGCHKPTGLGIPGYAPPLAGHMPDIEKAPGGRACLVQVPLHGLKGEIRVKGQRFDASMPAFTDLTDADAAAVLNRILANWGNDRLMPKDHKAITCEEVKVPGEQKPTAKQGYELREEPGLK